ncbi:MAG: hypothetical protein H7A37_03695 [Chlamydiales bacterium]|nr:hypothetical protein [Chlamydiia bacterium]MCP5507389.1 hypothetical protein [Chlamydiales bacterium]
MKENVLGRVKPEGYFAGAFFGEEHAWKNDSSITTTTVEKVKNLFASMNFTICSITEKKEELQTVFNGKPLFHTIEVIAQRNSE